MKIFLAIVAILIAYIGITQFISYLNSYDEIDITKRSKHLSKEEIQAYNQKKLSAYGNKIFGKKIDEHIFTLDGYKIHFTHQSYMISTDNNSVTVKVYKDNNLVFETTIELWKERPSVYIDYANVAFDIFDNKLYLLYTVKKEQEQLFLLVADLKENKIVFNEKILQQRYGFNGISTAYHEQTNSVLIAYQDISISPSDEGFIYCVYNLTNRSFTQKPHPLFLNDKWEKSHPHFMRDKGQLYLLNTTGENWGVLAYSGAPAKGISKIDSHGQAIDYFIMHESAEIIAPILEDNIFTYMLRQKDEKEILQIKSVDIGTLYKLRKE